MSFGRFGPELGARGRSTANYGQPARRPRAKANTLGSSEAIVLATPEPTTCGNGSLAGVLSEFVEEAQIVSNSNCWSER